jgi:hypothetical protein
MRAGAAGSLMAYASPWKQAISIGNIRHSEGEKSYSKVRTFSLIAKRL